MPRYNLWNHAVILRDLESIINYIEHGSRYFFDKYSMKNENPLELKTSVKFF